MRRHVPFKATIRQPIRTLIFVLLVGLASFGFVSRAVEYIILNREMNRIEQFYRTTGSLVPIDPIVHNNVYEAANIIRNSPYVQFEDRRAIVQGELNGFLNAMRGQQTVGGNPLVRGQQMFDYKGLGSIFDSIAIIQAERVHTRQVFIPGDPLPHMKRALVLNIHEVLFGHDPFMPRTYLAVFDIDENDHSVIDHLQEGGFYMVRAIQQNDRPDNTAIDLFPLFDDVYFVDARDRDAMNAAFRTLADDIAILEANAHTVMITGTKDMTAMPLVQSGVYDRFQGRFLGYEDYLNANHVIVVPQRMESIRRYARIGETIMLTLRDMRTFADGAPMPPTGHPISWMIPEGAEAHWRNIPAGYWVGIPDGYQGNRRNYPTIEIEVEVVGTYVISDRWSLPRWMHISQSFQNIEVFVPASIIPEGFGIVDAHIVSGAYSFVLTSPDADIPFLAAHAGDLAYHGFTVQFMGEDPTNFLLSAVPIRNSIRINLLLFSAVLALVLVLMVFLFLRQRYKEFAILRALGISQGNAIWQVAVPVLVFWIPITIIASIGAWYFALHQAAANLQVLAELGTLTDHAAPAVVRNILEQMRYEAEQLTIRATPELNMIYLVWLCAGIILAWVGTVFVGTVSFARKSMISLIQGVNSGGAPTLRAIKEVAPVGVTLSNFADILLILPVRRASAAIQSAVRHHWRHVYRAPVKSVLVVGMALLFIVALGWLDRTITFTEQEIERLYATTVITGEIISPNAGLDAAMWGHDIPYSSIERLMASEFVQDVYLSALSVQALLASSPADIEMCDNTHELGGLAAVRDFVLTISCWDAFVYEATRPAPFGIALTGDFTVEFMPGFDPADFTRAWRDVDWNGSNEVEEEPAEDECDDEPSIYVQSVTTHTLMDGRVLIAETWSDGSETSRVMGTEHADIPPIPIVVHESLLMRLYMMDIGEPTYTYWNGVYWFDIPRTIRYISDDEGNIIPQTISLGDEVFLVSRRFVGTGMGGYALGEVYPAIIVGVYSGGHPGVAYRGGEGLILVSDMRFTNFSTATFTIYQEKIRYMFDFVEDMNERLTYQVHHEWYRLGWGMQFSTDNFSHVVELNDAEFRTVIVPLEENLNLLRILYPVAKVMSFVLALGLTLLLMLQNAKNVAILRVLGSPRYKIRFSLCLEQLAVCITGVAIGLVAVLIMGIGIGTAGMLVGIYLAGTAVGTVVGVLVISYKTPLELLQVRE